jgi:hypothetical protein
MMPKMFLVLACLLPIADAHEHGARDWELENAALRRAGEMNDAELGFANLQQAMQEPQLMLEVAQMMRQPENFAEASKLLSSPEFHAQAKSIKDEMGTIPDFFRLEFYGERFLEQREKASALSSLLLALNPPVGNKGASNPKAQARQSNAAMETLVDLQNKATELNPVIGYFDPLGLSKMEFWGTSNEATIGFLRHSEIKHGRVAMMGFVGYMVHENGIRWPIGFGKWGPPYSELEGLSAPEVWEKTGWFTKLSMLAGIGALEWWGESQWALSGAGERHYMSGGKPGYYPPLKDIPVNGYQIDAPLNYFDPLGKVKKMSEEQKARRLNVEINNGRLAMLGLMSLISEAKVPGSVPVLQGVVKSYSGDVMNPLYNTPFPKLFQLDDDFRIPVAKKAKKFTTNVLQDLFPFFFGDWYRH